MWLGWKQISAGAEDRFSALMQYRADASPCQCNW
jgi:hypothetical protein